MVMRAKDEAKFLAEAYKTVIQERVVDGELMCPEACCGKPVMECKCGPDCPHCNCHEIQKLTKEEDAEGALGNLVKGVGRGVGDIATGVGRVGLAAGGAGAAAAGGALGAALKIAKTLTADQLQKLGEYALKKSAEDEEDKDFDDEQRDQDPFRHDEGNQVFGLVDASGKIVSLYDNEGIMRQVMEGRPDLKVVPLDELPFNAEI